jgi:Flp pilus assembly protein TadD
VLDPLILHSLSSFIDPTGASQHSWSNPLLPQSNPERAHTAPAGSADNLLPGLCNEAFGHHRAGRFAKAIALYSQILSVRPDLPEIYNNLGHALAALGKPEPAALAFQCATELKSDHPKALCNWGLVLAEMGRSAEAEAKYREAIRIDPGFDGAYNDLGLLLKEEGRLSEARQAFEQAIELAPRNVSYYDNLAAVKPFVAGDRYLAALESFAADPAAFSATDQIHLHFALAKANEGLDRPEIAFQHLLSANRLKRQQMPYDEAATLGRMDRLRQLIDRDFIEAREGCGDPSAIPVFIIGMTRSGTTLIEQILASHPKIFAAGEVDLLDKVAGSMRNALPGLPPFPEMMLRMSPEHFRALGAQYVEGIARQAPEAVRVTDKMTVNFLFAGLIHLALPNATIIHAIRDPRDTCVSSFSMHFTKQQEHTYDLAELGRYYRHYRTLMAHWHAVLPPGRIMDVQYEELVADFEGVARRIVSHCGVAWDARCLDFHSTKRQVRTASAVQVRRPIYRDAVGRWRKYEAFLEPLLAELGPLAT